MVQGDRRQDRAGEDTTVQDMKRGGRRTGQDRTGLENGLDSTIPEAWRSSQLIASHGPCPVGAVVRTGQNRTGQDRTGLDRTGKWLETQYLRPGDPGS